MSKEITQKKPKLDWVGGLKELGDTYSSVELQHKINDWRVDVQLKVLSQNKKECVKYG